MKFFKKSRKQETNKWTVYQSRIGENPAIITVDTSYITTNYKHTLSVNVAYNITNDNKLPDKEQNDFINQLVDMIIEKVKDENLNVYYVGSACFNGVKYLIFITNEEINWKSYIDAVVTSPRIGVSVYNDDNMGYYKKVLYPPKNTK